MKMYLRPPAVPLVTVDPYFSVWSPADQLYDEHTVHWTGKRNGMVGMLWIDGVPWRFLGKTGLEDTPAHNVSEPIGMEQTALVVHPLSSVYTFRAEGIELEVDFTTPLLMEDLDLLSRPASYISFRVRSTDGRKHDVRLYLDITGEWCVNTPEQEQQVIWGRKQQESFSALYMGNAEQRVLGHKGDDIRIDWGYVYLALPGRLEANDSTGVYAWNVRQEFMKTGKLPETELTGPVTVQDVMPVMAVALELGEVEEAAVERYLVVAYDDIASIEYFGKPLPGYWKRNGESFGEMLAKAIGEYSDVMKRCGHFNARVMKEGAGAGGEAYADILALACRQAVAAHKLVADEKGEALFFSKECFSNGCMATVDVSYPSVPIFLLYNPELVKGMLRPVFRYAVSGQWPFDFAPHDVGCYPKADGQVYGLNEQGELLLEYQMPVEECGNMLIMTAAVCLAEGKADFAREYWELLTCWKQYLEENGEDPGNQLCTDDFAGHLAHNTNLSVKAIMGIGGYSILCRMLGLEEEADRNLEMAGDMAKSWEKRAAEEDHYKLTFVDAGTWSLKYNMIWDDLFGLSLFSREVKEKEVRYYLKKQDRYGIPLDSRRHYTKSDWLVWAASLAQSKEDFIKLVQPLWDFLQTTPSRVPFTDWYSTTDRMQQTFQHRSVIGGVFAGLLKEKGLARK